MTTVFGAVWLSALGLSLFACRPSSERRIIIFMLFVAITLVAGLELALQHIANGIANGIQTANYLS